MTAVSVIIPTYNRAQYLPEAIGSVLGQTYHDFEIIVIDDGSVDDTREVVAQIDGPIRYYYQENQGRSRARNRGVALAKGRYVLFLDSDDLLLPNALETLSSFLDCHPEIGVAYADGIYTDASGRGVCRISDSRPGLTDRTWLEAFAVNNVIIACNSALVRKEWLDRLGYPYFDEGLMAAEDSDLWLRLAHVGCQYQPLEELVCKYRIHDQSTYVPSSPAFQKALANVWEQRRKVFSSEFFFGLSGKTQRTILYEWLMSRARDPKVQEEAFGCDRFAKLEPWIQGDILYYVGVQNVIDGYEDIGRHRLERAAKTCPHETKYRMASWLAQLCAGVLKLAVLARRQLARPIAQADGVEVLLQAAAGERVK